MNLRQNPSSLINVLIKLDEVRVYNENIGYSATITTFLPFFLSPIS